MIGGAEMLDVWSTKSRDTNVLVRLEGYVGCRCQSVVV